MGSFRSRFIRFFALVFAVGLGQCSISSIHAETNSIDSHSVVQVMAYDAIYGIYPVLRGWGSASVINDQGIILTNNHVVTTDDGRELPFFVICMADTPTSIPRCDYVASIISRDEKKDVALLQIAPKDIAGGSVNYSVFRPLTLDYGYTLHPQDKTVAVGFPGIGGNTMTQTVGVVAGIQQYNDARYIKTDTLIAPGNSGGPLLFDNKQIGINTFGDGSLGFALAVSEIERRIQSSLTDGDSDSIQSINPQTLGYIKMMYQANQTKKVSDSLFSFTLPEGYVINSYIPGIQLAGQKESPDATSVQNFMIKLSQYPMIGTGKQDKDIFFRQYYGYDPSYTKMETVQIGGINFVTFNYKGDINEGDANPYKYYVAIIDQHHVIDLYLYAGWAEGSKQIKEVQDQIKTFTAHIGFVSQPTLSLPRGNITFVNPMMTIRYASGMTYNMVDGNDFFARYGRWGSNLVGSVSFPRSKKSHEQITINVAPRMVGDGVNKTIDELYAIKTESISPQNKTRLTLRGNPGFAYCVTTPSSVYSLGGRASFVKQDSVVGPGGSPIAMGLCRVELYLGEEQDYIVYVDLFVERENLTKHQRGFLNRLVKILDLPSQGDGATSMPARIMQPKKAALLGVSEQTIDFQNLVSYLQYNNLIPSVYTSLSQPLTYRQYIELMSTMVYGTKAHVDSISKKISVGSDMWMNSSTMTQLDTIIGFTLAGVDLPSYSPKQFMLLETLRDTTYKNQWQEYNTYVLGLCDGEQKPINIYAYYQPYLSYIYSPDRGLYSYEWYPSTGSIATPSLQSYPLDVQQCIKRNDYGTRCSGLLTKYMISSSQSYNVLTLGEAINNLSSKINMCIIEKKNKKS